MVRTLLEVWVFFLEKIYLEYRTQSGGIFLKNHAYVYNVHTHTGAGGLCQNLLSI